MKKTFIIITSIVILIALLCGGFLIAYKNGIGAPSNTSQEVEFEVMENQTYSTLGKYLYNNGLIKSELFYKIYIKSHNPNNLQKGTYKLNKNMNLQTIINTLSKGSNYNPNLVNVTFKEGWNIRKIATAISENTNNTYEDVLNQIAEKNYINELINTYWFLTTDILNEKIYYPLEGYLFPETYQFEKTYSVKEILKVMLDHTDKILTEHKTSIENSSYSIHQMMTLASIVELEAGTSNDRKGVAGVFYNRLNAGWSLGSDVTTYYASKIDDFKYSLTYAELDDCTSGYNTRCKKLVGLPVGPISNPSKESIIASIEPTSHNYYYFVADCSGKTYLNKDSNGHTNTINQLKAAGNWCA